MKYPYLTYDERSHEQSGLALQVSRRPTAPLQVAKLTPFWDRPWISPETYEAVYGHKLERMRTYAVVDPTVRRAVDPLDDLEDCDLPTVSLFKGEAKEELADVAPVLVDISGGQGAHLAPAPAPFFGTLFSTFWSKRAGIILRSTATLEELQSHLRRFTRMKRSDGQWFFNRFWEPLALGYHLCGLRDDAQRMSSLFTWRGQPIIDEILCETRDGGHLLALRLPTDMQLLSEAGLQLRDVDWQLLSEFVEIDFYSQLVNDLADAHAGHASREQVDAIVRYNLGQLHNYGLTVRRDIIALNEASLRYGTDLHTRQPFASVWSHGSPDLAVLGKYVRLWAA